MISCTLKQLFVIIQSIIGLNFRVIVKIYNTWITLVWIILYEIWAIFMQSRGKRADIPLDEVVIVTHARLEMHAFDLSSSCWWWWYHCVLHFLTFWRAPCHSTNKTPQRPQLSNRSDHLILLIFWFFLLYWVLFNAN